MKNTQSGEICILKIELVFGYFGPDICVNTRHICTTWQPCDMNIKEKSRKMAEKLEKARKKIELNGKTIEMKVEETRHYLEKTVEKKENKELKNNAKI